MTVESRQHVWHKCVDESCYVCSRGLAECDVCGAADGELTYDCPGVRVPIEMHERVGCGEIDFVGGEWVDYQHRKFISSDGRVTASG